jgi:general secretion pathway protein D
VSCKNTPMDKVLDNKKENPENYKNSIIPIQEKEKLPDVSKDVVKAVSGTQGTLAPEKVGSLYSVKRNTDSASLGKPFYSIFEEKQKDFGDINHVSMSYNAAPIDEIIPVFAKILGFDFYLDANVKGVVTMTVGSDLSKKEIWMIFEQILLFTGSYCSMDSGIVHIQPLSMMSQERRLGPGFGYEANVSVVLFRLNNAKSSALVQQLKPFMTNGAVLIDMADQNSVLVVETPSNVPKLKAIVGMLDVSTRVAWPKMVIRCVNVPPTKVADELTKILPVLGLPVQDVSTLDSASAKKDLTPGSINIQGVDRLQLLVVSAANTEVIEEIKKWVDVLDRNDVGDQPQVYVYNVLHGRAEDLVQTFAVIFNVQGAILTPSASTQTGTSSSTSSTSPSGTPSPSGGGSNPSPSPSSASLVTAYDVTQLTQKQESPQPTPEDPKNPKKTPVSAFDVPSSVMADAINQRLVIKAAPRTYAIMKALLDRIDTIPKQVLLDIMIADVNLTNNTSLGTEIKNTYGSVLSGSTVGTDYGTTAFKGASSNYGFEYLLLNNGQKSIFVHALQTNGKATTLAAPQILVQSNTQAKISIGQSIPVQSQQNSTQQTVGSPTIQTSYTYKDTGIIVNATPHITRGNFVSIDFNQTISDVQDPKTANADGTTSVNTTPTINQRTLATTLVLPDGGTIIIGGLIRDKRSETLNTVPFFGNIPLINRLAGQTTTNVERTELLVLLTINIINKTSDVEAMSDRYKESVDAIKKLYSEEWKDANQTFNAQDRGKIYIK